MKSVVWCDMKAYVKEHGRQILASIIAAVVCFGSLALSRNIRIDTEELLNNPGATLGWLYIGRYSLALFKSLLGLGTHSAVKSGILFLVFFIAGEVLLEFAFYYFSGKNEKYSYGIFTLLYLTSNIWSYQIYFSMQQAEVALAMLLTVIAAFLSMRAAFYEEGKNWLWWLVSTALLVLGLGAYQALAAYYITICMTLFLVLMEHKARTERKETGLLARQLVRGIIELLMQFGIAYLLYDWIANTWFLAAEGYMQDQKGWGRMSVGDCIHAVLLTGKNTLLGCGPRNFSFYTIGVLLAVLAVWIVWKKKIFQSRALFGLYLLALAGVLFSPFLMTLYMGEMLVTRSQFALPVTAAFLGMYGAYWLDELCENFNGKAERRCRYMRKAITVLVIITVAAQVTYNMRLADTDDVRYTQDSMLTEEILAALEQENGGNIPEKPIVFVGYRMPEYNRWCARTEMYGWSFYEWDYSKENPTGATHRIAGFIQAYNGTKLNEAATEEMREEAATLAADMPDFPAEGSIAMEEDFVVVRLSQIEERTDLNWW